MEPTAAAQDRDQRFQALFDAAHADLLRFVRRRVHPTHAEDVVSEVMLVAWRRLDDVPSDLSAARAWLFGVARHTLMNAGRRERKHDALPVLLAETTPVVTDGGQAADVIAARIDIATAWRALNVVHQEALALAVLDGLSSTEAAVVLGISPTAFRLRLSRARRSLRHLLEAGQDVGRQRGSNLFVRSSSS